VICDLATLDTLPRRELVAGLAEVIKYGPIADAAFLDGLEAHLDDLLAREPAALAHAVRRSCEIKAAVVGQDERESGLRAILSQRLQTSQHRRHKHGMHVRRLRGVVVIGAGLRAHFSVSSSQFSVNPTRP
jgi:hypothetical protein